MWRASGRGSGSDHRKTEQGGRRTSWPVVFAAVIVATLETIPLALQDYMPGIATAIGCWFLGRFVRSVAPLFYPVAIAGGVSVACGGFAKATWKLIRAVDGPDLKWLDASLFPFLAWGFALLTWALIHVDFTETGSTPPSRGLWKVPLGIAASLSVLAFGLSATTDWSRAWVIPMIGLMTLGDLSVIVMGVKMARRRNLNAAAVLLVVNIASVLLLTRLASVDQTRALQWIEQIGNTIGNAAFAVAWWMILGRPLMRPATPRLAASVSA